MPTILDYARMYNAMANQPEPQPRVQQPPRTYPPNTTYANDMYVNEEQPWATANLLSSLFGIGRETPQAQYMVDAMRGNVERSMGDGRTSGQRCPLCGHPL